jgi:hypothetical protein
MLARKNEAIEFQRAGVFIDEPDLTLNRPLEFLVLLHCDPRL